MPVLTIKHSLAGLKPLEVPELRKTMSKEIGGELIELMLNDPEFLTGATVFVESEIIFVGESSTELGEPHLQLKVTLDSRGNEYLRSVHKPKQLVPMVK